MTRSEWLPSLGRVSLALAVMMGCPALALLLIAGIAPLRQRLFSDARLLCDGLTEDRRWAPALVMLVAVAALVARHPFPPDDLARDLSAWADHFDYRRMFWSSPLLPHFNQYIGFDHLAARARTLPPAWRALPFQLLPLAGLLAVMTAALYRQFPFSFRDRHLWVALLLLLTLLMPGEATRIVQGRPEVWFSVWLLSALVLPGWAWFGIGILLAPLYWLAPVYAAGAALIQTDSLDSRRMWRMRLAWGLACAVVSAGIWLVLSDGQWLSGFTLLARASAGRIGKVAETETVWTMLAGSTAAIYALALWYWRRGVRVRADADLLAVLVIFLLPDMVRYTDVISPLLVLLLARAIFRAGCEVPYQAAGAPCGDDNDPRHRVVAGNYRSCVTGPVARLMLVWACIFLLPLGFGGKSAPDAAFLAHVRPGDRILAPFSPALYRSIFAAAPHGARLAPAMEVGMTRRDVQRLAMDLSQGHIDCAALHRHHVRWIVESALHGPIPGCLRLDSTDGSLRAWHVTHQRSS